MAEVVGRVSQFRGATVRTISLLATGLLMGGCAGLGEGNVPSYFADSKPADAESEIGKAPQSELQKATE